MEAVIFVGIQASGKTTFYKQRFFNTHIRISLDMLKTRHRENLLIKSCLDAKQPFVIDNTNVLRKEREKYILAAKIFSFKVTGYFFKTNLKDSIKRNQTRSGKEFIPLKGIIGTYKKLQLPGYDEGFDRLYNVMLNEDNEFDINEQLNI